MEIIITNKARNDLYNFFYKSKGNTSNYVLNYIKEVIDYIDTIRQSPLIGKVIYIKKKQMFRQLIYRKHKIIYIILNNKIYILRIIHSARNFNLKSNLNLNDYP